MLGNAHASASSYECRRCRNVERARGIAARAASVHQHFIGTRALRENRRHVPAHGAGKSHQFPDRLAFCAQRSQQRDDGLFLGAPGKDLLHRAFGFLAR